MADHPRQREAVVRVVAAVVAAALPVRVAHDGTGGHGVEGETLRVQSGGGRDGRDAVDEPGVALRPVEGVRTAETAADDGVEVVHPDRREEASLSPRPVADGDGGELGAVRVAGPGVGGDGTG